MFETNHIFGSEQLTSGRTKRTLAVGLVVLMMASLFVTPAAAQSSGIDLCGNSNFSGSQFHSYLKTIISLIVYGGLIAGTLGIVIGFAAESIPGMSEYQEYKGVGLKYGWGLPIILYGLKVGGSIIGLNVGCLFPV